MTLSERWLGARGLGILTGVLLALMWPAYVHAQPIFDTASTSPGADGTTDSWSHTVTSSGASRVLIVGVAFQGGSGIGSSVTFNGDPMTEEGSVSESSNVTSRIYSLVNPDAGAAYTIQVTLTSSAKMISGATSFRNVDQTVPVGSFFSASGSNSTPSVNVTGVALDELVIDTLGLKSDPTATKGASQTER